VRLLISQIRTDGGTQARARIDLVTVQEYAQSLQEGYRFPPVVVFWVLPDLLCQTISKMPK
jgi:hypothetical protein